MNAQRVLQTSVRRLATQRSTMGVMSGKFASPAAIAMNVQLVQKRPATTVNVADTAASDLLVKQRVNRPVAPHLTIYKAQTTWYLSALNRITGCMVSGAFYVYGIGYLIAPTIGWHWESASIAAAFGALPIVAKVGIKMFAAAPFVFHSVNGFRHLAWDMGMGINNKAVMQTGWAAVALSAVLTAYLSLAY